MAATDPTVSARDAGLIYTPDAAPGIGRHRAGRGFAYTWNGTTVQEASVLERIRALAIPPAWTDVWINPDPRGHLQATGRDARGRKQYRYHARWRGERDQSKFGRLPEFARRLPALRRRVRRDLARSSLDRDRVLAAVVRLLEGTLARVGNPEYARANNSFGLTTVRNRHVRVRGPEVRLRFRGKSGREHEVTMDDPRVARVVARCRDLPGQELFSYLDGDTPRSLGSADVNAYVREATGDDFTAKDFRTWAGTVLAASALRRLRVPHAESSAKRAITGAVARVAEALGNTAAVARASYIHPAVLEAFRDGSLHAAWDAARPRAGLSRDEAMVASLLRTSASRRPERRKDRAA